ncbi:MAG: metal-dependent transcriptional regulator, partial [Pseudarcicella sp.]|nr:metal-dependent transcriptional regulator [Pseudarcicella sp.]
MQKTSLSEENYLKTIYQLSLETENDISTNALAEKTQTKAASVSDMIRKLSDKEMLSYQKYQGFRLTASGEKIALNVIRKHRLWEVFLVEKLKFNWDEVHEIAEQLEHIQSPELVEKLDDFLGNPKFDPHGDPIPDAQGKMPKMEYRQLANCTINDSIIMMGVAEHSTNFLQYLVKIGLQLGVKLTVTDFNEFDKSMQLVNEKGESIFLSYE